MRISFIDAQYCEESVIALQAHCYSIILDSGEITIGSKKKKKNVDNGVNPTLFKASLSKFARAQTSR